MRLYEFSKQIGIPTKKLLEALQKGGFTIKSHMSILADDAISFLNKQFKKQQVTKAPPPVKPEKASMQKEQVKKKKFSVPKQPRRVTPAPVAEKLPPTPSKEVVVEPMSVAQTAARMDKSAPEIIVTLLKWGIVVTINQVLSEEVVERLAEHYELKTAKPEVVKKEVVRVVAAEGAKLEERLPIIVVLGHVDHGKTTLLDFIRKTRVAAKEKGGITQHLGAYEATTPQGNLVFLDTPGHEAFSKMRERGTKAADIAVLVVAADDGVMPQTIEAIKHAKNMELPIIVAINKIDKADPSRIEIVKRQLAEQDVLPEDWGGQAICIPISATQGTGINQLLEMIVLQAQIMELRAAIQVPGKGFVLESKLEKGRGPVATLIFQHGSIKIGDYFICGNTAGRVTSLVDSYGNRINEIGPSKPVQVAGFDQLPEVGDFFEVVPKEQALKARSDAERKRVLPRQVVGKGALTVIIKADTNSSKEALIDAIGQLSKRVDVGYNIIHTGVGNINESDVELAFNTGAEIIGLHIKPESNAAVLAQRRGVSFMLHGIIYKLLEELEERAESKKEIKMVQKKIGEAIVRQVFDIKGVGVVAGSYVKDGIFSRDGSVVAWRGNQKIGEGKITSLQREKKTVKEVHAGFECGFVVEGITNWAVDDRVECFIQVPMSKKK